ncbi:MAG: O-succinylhomoserine sulfhydrylase [Actinomycetia bacterium]|nr:O-succinylhomoserine sulfhydrylase [Actinomycetes bacterium]MCP4960120.1 O-succinylhomoserine sulfhydrylase [Actinomycetes bacterium]
MNEPSWRPDTLAVRGGVERSQFDETAEAIYATSGFVYSSAAEAEAAFSGDIDRFVYGRYGNPTVAMFEERLRLIEGAEACLATASGMAAVWAALACQLSAGDRVVASRALFGSCTVVINEILPRFGIETEVVDGTSLDEWRNALARGANAVFLETPSNPGLEIIDIGAVCELAHEAGATVVVDNIFASPVLQSPLAMGADVIVYSATKHIDGQGRTLGGAILGTREFIEDKVMPFTRHTGPSLSPFNAWVFVKGLETMRLRVEHSATSALKVAEALEGHERLVSVCFPGLPSHPQHGLAMRQMSAGGTVLTLTVEGGKDDAFRMLDSLELVDISNNLGDSKSLITHPATTTHRRVKPEMRAQLGITDGMARLSIGLEDPADIIEDLEQALRG